MTKDNTWLTSELSIYLILIYEFLTVINFSLNPELQYTKKYPYYLVVIIIAKIITDFCRVKVLRQTYYGLKQIVVC